MSAELCNPSCLAEFFTSELQVKQYFGYELPVDREQEAEGSQDYIRQY